MPGIMAKPFNIHASYQGQTQLIEALPENFLDTLHEKFSIPIHTKLTIYQVARGQPNKEIKLKDMKDLMRIEVVDYPVENNSDMRPDNLEPNIMDDSAKDRITEKLTFNSALTGLEREQLIKMISQNKRRGNFDQNGVSKKPTLNKKIQSAPKLIESATQTDIKASSSSKGCFCGGSKEKNGVPSRDSAILTDRQTRDTMLRMANQGKLPDPVKTKELMDATYIARRNFIQVQLPTVRLVKQEYPLLFNTQEMQNELERIFISGKCKSFLQNVAKYSGAVLDMVNDDDVFLKKIKEKVRLCGTVPQKKYAREVGSLLMISSIMNESRAYLKLQNKKDKSPKPSGDVKYPVINPDCEDITSLLDFDCVCLRVCAESVVLCETTDFRRALLCLVAAYFVFDVEYAKECLGTLVLVEEIYLNERHTVLECGLDVDGSSRQKIEKLKDIQREKDAKR